MFRTELIYRSFKKAQLVLGFFFVCFPLLASSTIVEHSGISFSNNNLIALSSSSKWARIIGFADENWITKDQTYFLTTSEKFSPYDELVENIKEYLKFADNKSDFFCKTPARAIFLSYHLPQLPDFNSKRCSQYSEWSKNGEIESISLLYVTGYLKNPASFFGHTLLKFNASNGKANAGLLDSSLNYGAHTNNDAALPYVVRGLTGGYSASLVEEKFFRLSAEYQELQKRDIYEYQLSLSEYEKWLMIAFSFEMAQKEFTYYFLADNCAFRLNLILGLALERDPMPGLPWAAPIDLLMGITKSDRVDKITYHPSQTSRTVSALDTLIPSERDKVAAVINSDPFSYRGTDYNMLTKLAILETLNYFKIESSKDGASDEVSNIDEKRRRVLLSLDRDPAIIRGVSAPSKFPHEINKPTPLRYGLKQTGNHDPIISLQLRAANFEILDTDRTRKTNSEFIFLSPKIAIQNGRVRLDEMTLFKALSLNDSKIIIPGDSNFAWGVDIGKFNLSEKCYPCGVLKGTGTLGKSTYLTANASIYGLANLSLHESKNNSGNLSVSAQAGVLYTLESGKLNLDIKRIEYKGGKYLDDEIISMAYKFDFSNSVNISFIGEKAIDHWSFGLELNHHF